MRPKAVPHQPGNEPPVRTITLGCLFLSALPRINHGHRQVGKVLYIVRRKCCACGDNDAGYHRIAQINWTASFFAYRHQIGSLVRGQDVEWRDSALNFLGKHALEVFDEGYTSHTQGQGLQSKANLQYGHSRRPN